MSAELAFPDTAAGREAFEILHRGFILGTHDQEGEPIVAAIRAKLEAISRPCHCGLQIVAGYPARDVNGAQSVAFDVEELTTLAFVLGDVLPRAVIQRGS